MSSGSHDTLVHRLSLMLLKLNQGEALDPKALAEEFGVNLRTIQRDLNHRFTYLPLHKSEGRYRLDSAFLGQFTAKDVQAFAALAGVQGLFPQLTDEFLRDVFDVRMRGSVLVRGHHHESIAGREQTFRLAERAIADRRQISFRQVRNGASKLRAAVEPYRLLNHKGIWYLVAKEGGKLKTFAFSSVEDLLVSETAFEADPEVAKALRGDSLWIGAEPMQVIVSVASSVAHYFRRRPVLVNQSIVKELDDGGLLVSTWVGHENEVLPHVRYWIPHLRIVHPESFQARMAAELAAYVERSAGSAGAAPPEREAPKGPLMRVTDGSSPREVS